MTDNPRSTAQMGNQNSVGPRYGKGKGPISRVWTPQHTFPAWGRFFRTKEGAEEYSRVESLKRRMRDHGFTGTQEEYLDLENQALKPIETMRQRERRVKIMKRRIAEQYGLVPNCTRLHLKGLYERTQDPNVLNVIEQMDTYSRTDTQKLEKIHKLFMSELPPYDLLFQIAQVVGVNLRKKQ